MSGIVDAFQWEIYLLSLAFTILVGFSTAGFTRRLRKVYLALEGPKRPPPWIFGVAWSILYTLIGFAAAIIRVGGGPWTDTNFVGLVLYGVLQFVMALYTPLFAMRWFWTAFLTIGASLVLAILTAYYFFATKTDFSGLAGGFMVALCVWLAFALILQYRVARYNSNLASLVQGFSSGRSKGKTQKF